VIFAHFPNPDYFGHLTGWMSEIYLNQLRLTDSQVGRLLDTLDARGLTDKMLIILTADHGGHGFGHGDDIPEDRLIPWIIAGPGVVPASTSATASASPTPRPPSNGRSLCPDSTTRSDVRHWPLLA